MEADEEEPIHRMQRHRVQQICGYMTWQGGENQLKLIGLKKMWFVPSECRAHGLPPPLPARGITIANSTVTITEWCIANNGVFDGGLRA